VTTSDIVDEEAVEAQQVLRGEARQNRQMEVNPYRQMEVNPLLQTQSCVATSERGTLSEMNGCRIFDAAAGICPQRAVRRVRAAKAKADVYCKCFQAFHSCVFCCCCCAALQNQIILADLCPATAASDGLIHNHASC
jgi:hypothetical protein